MKAPPVFFLVFPDLGGAKAEALCRLSKSRLRVNVLLSYSTFLSKPKTRERLEALRADGCLGRIMLDSGAYHVAFHGLQLGPEEYAQGARSLWRIVDYVVGPDVPRRPDMSLRRLLVFSAVYPGEFIPTLQSRNQDPEGYVESLERLEEAGLLSRAPIVGWGRRLVGVGGLVGSPVRVVSAIVQRLSEACDCMFHLFGANVRIVRGLARRGLLDRVYSIDTSGWLSEIRWRRRTVYKASSTLDANMQAMRAYLWKLSRAACIRA